MSRGAWAVSRLLQGVPAAAVNLDEVEPDWRELAEAIVDAPDRGAALEAALAQRPDGKQRWAELLAADALDHAVPERPKRFRLVTPQGMKQLPRPQWQVDGLLHRNTLALLAGPESTFKSFVALDLALSVAGGQPWQGRPVHQGPVVYISAEGSAGMRNRLEAWEIARQTTASEQCYFIPDDAPQLLDGADVAALLEVLGELETPPALIIVDTLARCMVGGDENAAKDMGVFVAGAEGVGQHAQHLLLQVGQVLVGLGRAARVQHQRRLGLPGFVGPQLHDTPHQVDRLEGRGVLLLAAAEAEQGAVALGLQDGVDRGHQGGAAAHGAALTVVVD